MNHTDQSETRMSQQFQQLTTGRYPRFISKNSVELSLYIWPKVLMFLYSFICTHNNVLASPTNRSTARQKLTRLTIQQFHELSTDVYDELIRRKKDKDSASPHILFHPAPVAHVQPVPFLPVREEFHPKRNQARQKLATLPIARFEDLSSDVYYELARRYPEFKEDVGCSILLMSCNAHIPH